LEKQSFVVQKFLPHKKVVCCAVAIALLATVAVPLWVYSDSPRIEYIESVVGTNQVRIHYGTPPSRSYVLQRLVLNTNGVVLTNWTDMHTGFAFPFTNHYIIPDVRTNQGRFYRLRVVS